MPLAARHHHPVEEYLLLDDHSEGKLEFWQGEILAMAGGSPDHNRICVNLLQLLSNGLENTPCEPFGSDQRVHLTVDAYAYPDVTVACGPQFVGHSLTNPQVLIEVLSPSTEAFDREQKLPTYQQLPSVTDILLVSSDSVRIEHCTRTPGGWTQTMLSDGALHVLGVNIPLSAVYKRVFP